MPIRNTNSSVTLAITLILTFSLCLVKAGAPTWVALFWTAMCAITVPIAMYSSPSLRTDLANTRKNLGAFLPAIYLILFQLWSLLQFSLLSVDKTASLNQSMIGMGFTLLLTLWFFNIRLNKAMTALYACIVTFTTIQAGYGIWVFLSEANLLLWMPKLHYLDRPTGFFVNSNHFASYVVLAIIVCLSHSLAKAHRQHHQNIFATLSDAIYSPKLIILGFLLITLILTKSIGALVALSVVFSIMTLNVIRKSRHKKSISFGLASLVLIAIAILLTLDYSIIEDEISGFEHTFLRRVELSKAGFAMLKNNWLFGIGGGSFYSQFSQYRTLEIGNTYYNYAHNDFLQFWIEYGLLGVSLLTLFIITIVRDNLRVLADRTTTMKKTFAYASLYSIISVAIHSLVDFPLHMPGFAALFLVIISINSLSFMHEALFFDVHEQQS